MQGRILVVEDDPLVARVAAKTLARFAPTDVVHRTVDAMARLREHRQWHAVLVDLDLQDRATSARTSDRAGLAVAAVARLLCPEALVGLWTAAEDPQCRKLARALRIDYVPKPADLVAFAERAVATVPAVPIAAGDAAARRLAWEALLEETLRTTAECGLTPAQATALTKQVEALETRGEPFTADHARDLLGISPSTYKKHIAAVLDKTHAQSLEQLLQRLQWRARVALAKRTAPGDSGSSGVRRAAGEYGTEGSSGEEPSGEEWSRPGGA